ncbi:hypothetical protein [Hymenobacter sp. B81]|uniref:hypothetical protein n=1 Tax=Hymenobacter sp. B81 TaxID=3344878 RepID=UPI0037DC8143
MPPPTDLPSLPFYSVHYEANPPLLFGVNPRALSPEEVTEACELLLDQARRHGCPYWLLDGRLNGSEQPRELHEWMQEEYFPRVRTELGRMPSIAFLVTPQVWAGLPTRGYDEPGNWQSRAARMAWFTDDAPALDWLRQQRQLAAAGPR